MVMSIGNSSYKFLTRWVLGKNGLVGFNDASQ